MSSYNTDVVRIVGKDFFELVGEFTITSGSAVGVQNPTVAQGNPVAVTKPAGTGIYRCTLSQPCKAVLWNDAVFKVAGTYDRLLEPLTENTDANGHVSSVDFQVRKKSDGTVVDPVSSTVRYRILCKNSSLTP